LKPAAAGVMDKLVSYNFMHKSNQYYYISAYLHPSKYRGHFSHMIEAGSAAQVLGTSILRPAARCRHQNLSIWPIISMSATALSCDVEISRSRGDASTANDGSGG
jgi:hypothetical protein